MEKIDAELQARDEELKSLQEAQRKLPAILVNREAISRIEEKIATFKQQHPNADEQTTHLKSLKGMITMQARLTAKQQAVYDAMEKGHLEALQSRYEAVLPKTRGAGKSATKCKKIVARGGILEPEFLTFLEEWEQAVGVSQTTRETPSSPQETASSEPEAPTKTKKPQTLKVKVKVKQLATPAPSTTAAAAAVASPAPVTTEGTPTLVGFLKDQALLDFVEKCKQFIPRFRALPEYADEFSEFIDLFRKVEEDASNKKLAMFGVDTRPIQALIDKMSVTRACIKCSGITDLYRDTGYCLNHYFEDIFYPKLQKTHFNVSDFDEDRYNELVKQPRQVAKKKLALTSDMMDRFVQLYNSLEPQAPLTTASSTPVAEPPRAEETQATTTTAAAAPAPAPVAPTPKPKPAPKRKPAKMVQKEIVVTPKKQKIQKEEEHVHKKADSESSTTSSSSSSSSDDDDDEERSPSSSSSDEDEKGEEDEEEEEEESPVSLSSSSSSSLKKRSWEEVAVEQIVSRFESEIPLEPLKFLKMISGGSRNAFDETFGAATAEGGAYHIVCAVDGKVYRESSHKCWDDAQQALPKDTEHVKYSVLKL